MRQIPCEVVRDLLPLYIDGLTGAETTRLVKEHLDSCEECRQIYESMRAPQPSPEMKEEKKEIDFLKKNKKKNRRILIGTLALCALLIAAVLGLRTFVTGTELDGYWIAADVEVSNENKDLAVNGNVIDSFHGVSGVKVQEEEDGVVRITAKAVAPSPLHGGHFHVEYHARNAITQIWMNDRIVWEQGETILQQTAALYETRHVYVGDMPSNQKTLNVLRVQDFLGPFTNELETAAEPYGWKLILEEVPLEDTTLAEEDMDSIAYLLLGLVGNLDHVTFEGTMHGTAFTRTVTAEEASAFLGQNIKDCADMIRILNRLVVKTGLYTQNN